MTVLDPSKHYVYNLPFYCSNSITDNYFLFLGSILSSDRNASSELPASYTFLNIGR